MTDAALIDVRNLTVRYGGVVAVDAMDLRVSAGESVGLIGPNGSGKSTLLKAISGAVRPNGGDISYDGRSLRRVPAARRARHGVRRVFQGATSFPQLTVAENLDITLKVARSPRTSVAGLAERVGLGHMLTSPASALSWGQTRLLGIALAVAHAPRVLLLDEPLAGLNHVTIERVSALLHELRGEGATLMIVEHNIPALTPLVARLVVMHRGSLLAEGAPESILARSDVVEAYLGT